MSEKLEFREGDLVISSNYGISRLLRKHKDQRSNYEEKDPHWLIENSHCQFWEVESNLTYIHSNPPIVQGKFTVLERREILRDFISNIFSNNRWTYDKLYLPIFGYNADNTNRNFWNTVACGALNPRAVSYAINPADYDNDSKRRSSSWRKFLLGVGIEMGCVLTDEQIDTFCRLVGNRFGTTYDLSFSIVSGEDIISTYNEKEFGSCMFEDDDYLYLYTINPNIRMLRCMRGTNLIGRALLWTTDCGATVLDRIYPGDGGPQIAAMEQYAKSQGWEYRTNHSCGQAVWGENKGKVYQCTVNTGDYYPYIDSFTFTNTNPREYRLTLSTKDLDAISFYCTGGSWEGVVPIPCASCSILSTRPWEGPDGDVGRYCIDCWDSMFCRLEYFHYTTAVGNRDREVYSIRLQSDCVRCRECSAWTLPEHNYGNRCANCETTNQRRVRLTPDGTDGCVEFVDGPSITTTSYNTTVAVSDSFPSLVTTRVYTDEQQAFLAPQYSSRFLTADETAQAAILPSDATYNPFWGGTDCFQCPFNGSICPRCISARLRILSGHWIVGCNNELHLPSGYSLPELPTDP